MSHLRGSGASGLGCGLWGVLPKLAWLVVSGVGRGGVAARNLLRSITFVRLISFAPGSFESKRPGGGPFRLGAKKPIKRLWETVPKTMIGFLPGKHAKSHRSVTSIARPTPQTPRPYSVRLAHLQRASCLQTRGEWARSLARPLNWRAGARSPASRPAGPLSHTHKHSLSFAAARYPCT